MVAHSKASMAGIGIIFWKGSFEEKISQSTVYSSGLRLNIDSSLLIQFGINFSYVVDYY